MRIPQGSYDNEALAPAWLPISDRDGNKLKPIIRCKCGRLIGLGLHHVYADGRVTASFYHWWDPNSDTPMAKAIAAAPDQQGCGFHEWLELEGWTGGEFPPRTS